jgi:hypothetical protein
LSIRIVMPTLSTGSSSITGGMPATLTHAPRRPSALGHEVASGAGGFGS